MWMLGKGIGLPASRPPLVQGKETKTRHLLGQFASLGHEVQISPLPEAA